MRDYHFTLSRQTRAGRDGPLRVVNRGGTIHDFAIAHTKSKTRFLKPGQQQTITVQFKKAARVAYLCTVGGHAALGMKGTLVVGKPRGAAAADDHARRRRRSPTSLQLTLDRRRSTGPTSSPRRPATRRAVFVVEQAGVIRVIDDGVLADDAVPRHLRPGAGGERDGAARSRLRARLRRERALLRLLQPPRGQRQRLPRGVPPLVDRTRTRPIRTAARVVLTIVKPWENHNGGMLQFGPDGYLYVAVGDGDSGVLDPPGAFAQTLDDLLGNILRIDPRADGDQPYTVPDVEPVRRRRGREAGDLGLRLPQPVALLGRPGHRRPYVGDVGEGVREEIDYEPAGKGGFNFGWPCFEGTVVVRPDRDLPEPGGARSTTTTTTRTSAR